MAQAEEKAWFSGEHPEVHDLGVPYSYIQWKNTNVCLDFWCECGWSGHVDSYCAAAIECGGCGKLWEAPSFIGYRKVSKKDWRGRDPIRPESDDEYAAKTGIRA